MIKKLKSSALLFFCLAGVVLACTHVFGKKVIAINIVGPAGAEAMKAAIAAEVDAQYGNSELDVSYEEVRVMGSYNRGPLDRPIVKMCGQTFGDAVRASPTHLYLSGPIGGGGGGDGSGGGIGYAWVPIYGFSKVCVAENDCRVEIHIIGWRRVSGNQVV